MKKHNSLKDEAEEGPIHEERRSENNVTIEKETSPKQILIVLDSHARLRRTDFWLEELAVPYFAIIDAGAEVTLASPEGGQPPIDSRSILPDFKTDATRRFERDEFARRQLSTTLKLCDVNQNDFDAVFHLVRTPVRTGRTSDCSGKRDTKGSVARIGAAAPHRGQTLTAPDSQNRAEPVLF